MLIPTTSSAQISAGGIDVTPDSRWEDTDIDWFWFALPFSPPSTSPPDLNVCDESQFHTFSWDYVGDSDPAESNNSRIKDYVNWSPRVQRIGGPCWAFADAATIDIKYKIYFDLYNNRANSYDCGISKTCYFGASAIPLPHISEESIMSLRTYYSNYEGATPHLSPLLFGRAMSALGGGSISLVNNNDKLILFPRSYITYNYTPIAYLGSLFFKRNTADDNNVPDGYIDQNLPSSTYTRFSQPSFRNYLLYTRYFNGLNVDVPYVKVVSGHNICSRESDPGCYENIKRALACGLESTQNGTISKGPLRVGVFSYNGQVRNTSSSNHGNTLLGWIDKTRQSGDENPDFTESWNKLVESYYRTAPLDNDEKTVLIFNKTEMREAAMGILIGLEHNGNKYLVPYIPTELAATGYLNKGETELKAVNESVCSNFGLCHWDRDDSKCYCKFSYFKNISIGEYDYSNYFNQLSSSQNDDSDGDGIASYSDNCPNTYNPSQTDLDGDGQGDDCDPDADGDGVISDYDGDDLNAYIGPDINNNGYYEISWPRVFFPDTLDFDNDQTPDVFTDMAWGVGYNIIWNNSDFYSFLTDEAVVANFISECKNQCQQNYFGSSESDCEIRCDNLELFNTEPANPIDYPGEHSFACIYQNYFHPKCIKWATTLLSIEKMWNYFKANSDPNIPSIIIYFNFSEIEHSLSDAVGIWVKLMNEGPQNPNISNFANITLENLSTMINSQNMRDQSDFQSELLLAVKFMVDNLTDSEINSYSTLAKFEFPEKLRIINPCDASFQSKLFTFTYLKEGIKNYCEIQNPNNDVNKVLCENYYLGSWKSFDPVSPQVNSYLDPEIAELPDLSTWLDSMQNYCDSLVSLPAPVLRASQIRRTYHTGVHSGKIDVYYVPGISVDFKYNFLTWNGSSWVYEDTDDIPGVKLSACPCVGYDFTSGNCLARCAKTNVSRNHADFQETYPDGLFHNQAWDPIYANSADSFSGIDQKWIDTFQNQYLAEGAKYFKNKDTPVNTPFQFFSAPYYFRDYDKALHEGNRPLSSDDYKLLNGDTGILTPRISEQQADDVDENGEMREVSIRRVYGDTISIDTNLYSGVIHGAVVENWIPSEIWIIPHIAEGGMWYDPTSVINTGNWMIVNNGIKTYLMERGTSVVTNLSELSDDTDISNGAFFDVPSFHGSVLIKTAQKHLTSVVINNTHQNTSLQVSGELTGLKEPTIIYSNKNMVLMGIRKHIGLEYYTLSPEGIVTKKGEIPFAKHLKRINGTNDKIVVKSGIFGSIIDFSGGTPDTKGYIFLPGKLRGIAKTKDSYLYTTGGFIMTVDDDFSLLSLRILPKTGLYKRNLKKFEPFAFETPMLLGKNKKLYKYDYLSHSWVPSELIEEM